MKSLSLTLLFFCLAISTASAEFRTLRYTPPGDVRSGSEGTYAINFMQAIDDELFVRFNTSDSVYIFSNGAWSTHPELSTVPTTERIVKILKTANDTYIATDKQLYIVRSGGLSFINFPDPGYDLSSIENYNNYDRTIVDLSLGQNGNILVLNSFNINGQNSTGFLTVRLSEALVLNNTTVLQQWRARFQLSDIFNDVPEMPFVSSPSFIRLYEGDVVVASSSVKPAFGPVVVRKDDDNNWSEIPFNSPGISDDFSLSGVLFFEIEDSDIWISHYQINPNIGLLFQYNGTSWQSYGNLAADVKLPAAFSEHNSTFRPLNLTFKGDAKYFCTFGHGLVTLRNNEFSFEPINSENEFEPYVIQQIEFVGDDIWMRTGGITASGGRLFRLEQTATSVSEELTPLPSKLINTEYFSVLGQRLSADDLRSGMLYMRVEHYADGSTVSHKLIVD